MNRSFAKSWTTLGAVSLLTSGLLALFITGAKIPAVKHLVDPELIRWCLVVHVNLSTLVWFTALPMGLIYASSSHRGPLTGQWSWAGLLLAVIGLGMMFSVPPGGEVRALLANYIPVLGHPRYQFGLFIYISGVVVGLLAPKRFVDTALVRARSPGLYEVRFGLLVGALFLILAAVSFPLAFAGLSSASLMTEFRRFELGMWGGGHLIQHAAVVFLVCCWVLMLSRTLGRPLFSRTGLFFVFAGLGVPLFMAPGLFFLEPMSDDYRRGFSLLMQWGIAPPVILFLIAAARRLSLMRADLRAPEHAAFFLSAFLLLLGFVFGAFIRGPDMRVPGHYHASIGAVTLAYMVTTFIALGGTSRRWILSSVWSYGLGQSVFAAGMFMAGAFGMPRKTYGAEHIFTHWGQSAGIGLMAIGGLGAMLGGILFAFAILPHLRWGFRSKSLAMPDLLKAKG